MSRSVTPEQRAAAVASRQAGAIAVDQALAAGLSEHQILYMAERGLWRRVVRGVYVVAGSPDTWLQRAWVAHLATRRAGGALSHLTAGAVLGVLAPSPLPHVTVPSGSSARCPIARVHRSRLDPRDLVWRDGLRVTSPSRLIVDIAGVVPGDEHEALVDDVLCRRLATQASVLECAARVGTCRRGQVMARESVEVWSPTIEPDSVAEVRLLRHLGDLGLNGLVTQYEVRAPDGSLIGRVDLAQPHLLRGFEYDGVQHHGPRRWARDEARYAALQAAGWDIEPVTKADLRPGETRLSDLVERWNRRRAS